MRKILSYALSALSLLPLGCNENKEEPVYKTKTAEVERSKESELEQKTTPILEQKNSRILPEDSMLFADTVNKDGDYEIYKLDIPGAGSYAIVRAKGDEAKRYFGGDDFVLAWFAKEYWKNRGLDVKQMPGYKRWMPAGENNPWKNQLKAEMMQRYKDGKIFIEGQTYDANSK